MTNMESKIQSITTPWEGYKGEDIEAFIKEQFGSKAGYFYNDATNRRYLVFADEASKDEYLKTSDASLLIGEFSAGGGATGEAVAEIYLATPMYNAVFLGSTGNRIEYTFDIKNKQGQSTGESVLVTYTIIRGANRVQIEETKHFGQKGSINLDKYLGEGTNTISITVYGQTSFLATTVSVTYEVINLSLTDYLDISKVYNLSNNGVDYLEVPYEVAGSYTKTMEWYLDGVQLPYNRSEDEILETTSISRTKTIELSNLSHGRHNIQFRVGTKVNGEMFFSDILYRDFFVTTGTNDHVMLGVAVSLPASNGIIAPGETLIIPNMVQYVSYELRIASYSPLNIAKTEVSVFLDDSSVGVVTTTNGEVSTLPIASITDGDKTLKLVATEVELESEVVYTIPVTVTPASMNITEITAGLKLYFSAKGRSNNSLNRDEWNYGDIAGTLTGFKWNNTSGWVNDRLEIDNGSELHIAYAPLSNHDNGKTIEIEWKSKDVSDENAVLCDLRNDDGTGVLITASAVYVTSAGDVEMSYNYKPEEDVRFSIVINPSDRGTNKGLTFIYTNGIISRAVNILGTDNYKSDKEIVFCGTTGAWVSLKSIMVYDAALSSEQILNNHVLYRDTLAEMLEIYDRNDIFDGTLFSTAKMSSRLPVMIVTGDIPTLENTNDKDTQIMVDIEYINMQDTSRSFVMKNAAMRPQGTSSMGYPKKNFRIYTNKSDVTTLEVNGKLVEDRLYSFKEGAIPVDCWCLKADYAESSGTHNTGVARLWGDAFKNARVTCDLGDDNPHTVDEATVLRTQAQQAAIDNKYPYDVRTTIDGFPILLFYKRTENDDVIFIGKYNFNNDKSTEKVFGFTDIEGFDNSRMQCWELLNNGNSIGLFTDISDFYNDVVSDGTTKKGWELAFESRYPDTKTPITTDLYNFATWMNGVNGNSERFAEEKWEHLDVYKVAGYYCYLMRHGGADQFVKNSMLTSEDGEHFYFILYDNDTINGLNNTGAIAVLPTDNRESTYADGSHKFAGYDSVLWNMLEADEEFQVVARAVDNALYQAGISYGNAIAVFDGQQADKWVERVYNLDAEYKYLSPYTTNGTNNLFMLQGKRDLHRRWWLSNRYSLYDSIFVSGAYKSSYVEIKCLDETQPGQTFKVVSGYPIHYGFGINGVLRQRTAKPLVQDAFWEFNTGEKVNLGDPIAIYGAPHIKELDLSSMVDRISVLQVAGAYSDDLGTKLEKLIIGSSSKENISLKEVSGIKSLSALTHLNVANLKALTALDLSSNKYLQELDASGTGITGITFAEGAPLSKIYLPLVFKTLHLTSLPALSFSGIHHELFPLIESIKILDCPNLSNDFSWVYDWYYDKTVDDSNAVFEMDNIAWEDVDYKKLLKLANIGTLKLKGKVTITEGSQEIIDAIKAVFGDTVFNKTSDFYVKAPDGIYLTGPSELIEGATVKIVAAVFSESEGRLEWSIINGGTNQESIDQYGWLETTYSGIERTITIQARYIPSSGDILTVQKIVRIIKQVRPTSATINGESYASNGSEYTLSVSPSDINTEYSVSWSLSGEAYDAGNVSITEQTKEKCKIATVKGAQGAFTLNATIIDVAGTAVEATSKSVQIGAKMTLIIETNQPEYAHELEGVEATVTYGSSSTKLGNGGELYLGIGTIVNITFPNVTNYKTPDPIEFVNGEDEIVKVGTYLSEEISLLIKSHDGGSTEGAVVNVDGKSFTFNGGIIKKLIAFGKSYTIKYNAVNEYFPPSTMVLTASQAKRYIEATYEAYPDDLVIIDQRITDPATMISGGVNSSVINQIRAGSHRYLGKYTASGQMTLCQLKDTGSKQYFDGTNADLTGAEGDVFMKMPDFWYLCLKLKTDVWGLRFSYGPSSPGVDWIKWDGNALIGVYEASYINSKLRSISGVEHLSDEKPSIFNLYVDQRGEGFQLVDWQMHCVMAILFYARYGRTNSQEVIGAGDYSYLYKSGQTDSYGMRDTRGISPVGGLNDGGPDGDNTVINFWGLEGWWGNLSEWVSRVKVNNLEWIVTDPDGTDRAVTRTGISSGYISKFLFGSKCDLIPTGFSGSETTGFCDQFFNTSNPDCNIRRGGYANTAIGGIACIYIQNPYASIEAGSSSRIAFRGECVIETSVATFKSLEAIK